MNNSEKKVTVAILGASGYTGAELVRLLVRHPRVEITTLTAGRKAGRQLGEVFPHLAGAGLPDLVSIDAANWDTAQVAFCCLPHGTTQDVVAGLPRHLKVIDLSADFRIADARLYDRWYGQAHRAPELQKEAVYGLTELARGAVSKARLIANPGCYPTASLLALVPLLEAGLIEAGDIVIDAKSGVSGAGRAAKEQALYAEVAEGIQAYGVAAHRHSPEIEQELSGAAGGPVTVSFTPHLVPMNRGILATIYVRLAPGAAADDLGVVLRKRYSGEPFVRVVAAGETPSTHHVRGSNGCLIGVFTDRAAGRAIILSVIDNLVKGASGQAVQNMNVMCGMAETTGLEQAPLFP
ncbi:MAG TPA: N-acetyl-gamma-glutamyl-phosphate reductase [Rhodospirillales bacterium]|jgi:N-acetyl-gamma-glutamyl-phosphate reductase|nr:N-acetyl-gamma-glutamyl-phosphate reductase [Rhodospirillales bacterium]